MNSKKGRPSAHHKNSRSIPPGALSKDEALQYLGVAVQTLDYYISKGYVTTFRSGKYCYLTLESVEQFKRKKQPDITTVGEKWLSTAEFAKATGLSRSRIAVKCRNGEINCVKGASRFFINPEEVDRYNNRFHSVGGKRTVTVREAAEICGCFVATMRNHVYAHHIPSIMKDGVRLIIYDDLMDYKAMLKNGRLPPKAFQINSQKRRRERNGTEKEKSEKPDRTTLHLQRLSGRNDR